MVVDCLLTEAKRKTLLVSFTPRYRKKETLNIKMNYFCAKFPGSHWAKLSRTERRIRVSPKREWMVPKRKAKVLMVDSTHAYVNLHR